MAELEHGVRYVTVRVKTRHGMEDIAHEVHKAIEDHRRVFAGSAAKAQAFKETLVVDCQLAFEYQEPEKPSLWRRNNDD